jgi:SAM-dependent methyltransferase
MYPGFLRPVIRRIPSGAKQALRAGLLRVRDSWRAWNRGAEPAAEQLGQPCRYCLQADGQHLVLGEVGVTHHGPFERDAYQLLQCARCEVVYLEPVPSTQDLITLYQNSEQFSDPHYSDPEQAARILDFYSERLQRLDLTPAAGAHCLEVGAGLAWVSKAVKRHRPDAQTWAQDVSSECVQSCPWVDHYQVGALENLAPMPAMQLISLTHVIEHVPDPNLMLAQLMPLLQPGGKIYITAPYRPALWKTADGIGPWRDYSYLHVPAHISYLSESWFRQTAARVGLDLIHWEQNHDAHQALEAVLQKPAR